ncbi:hypothetical protein FNH05_32205 [Amycolatopsis rhizosphaerae]|uniref:Uncharacterized protein n=1 Tax=Amycolatopsis rhizosphaerae TaxID=2053003 RepID=A0A558ALR5_9PSEU|nr:hypothetical protein [Amycolatopsis rhizosphaerae]TVT25206.1 hypothetical protein FNH05_32205 [Amycolatopsis rhizosphaerae]
MEVSFGEDRILFLRYDFPGATVHPTGTLTAGQIRDADWELWRPEIRTTLGETLFVPHEQQAELKQFCLRNDIAGKQRLDIWSDLLEPFLDTEFSPEHVQATDNRLRQAGLSCEEAAGIRRRLTPLMHAYNFDSMLWEWVDLNLYDLLSAATGPLVAPGIQAALGDLAEFYGWAMEIADRRR